MPDFTLEAAREWMAGLKRTTCHHPECSRWFTVAHLKSHPVGVRMGAAWYCSYGCFQSIAQEEIAQMLATRPSHSSSKPTMSLGLELIGRGQLTAAQLRIASEQTLAAGRDVGDIFVEHGFVTEAQVAAARAAIWGCPVYNPSPAIATPDFHIPPVLSASCLAVAMHYVPATRQLLLGFLRGVDYELMFALENMTGCIAKACFVKPSDFYLREAQTHISPSQAAEAAGMTFDTPYTNGERAKIVSKYAAGMNANRVKMTRCKNYLWVRLQGGSAICDLLFNVDS